MITAIYSQKNVLEIKVGLRPFAIRKKKDYLLKKKGTNENIVDLPSNLALMIPF